MDKSKEATLAERWLIPNTSLVGVTCESRKAQHNAICCPRLILTFHNQTPQCRRCGPDLEPIVLRYEFTMLLCSAIWLGESCLRETV